MLEYCFEFEPTVEKTGIRTNTGRPTSRLLHSLYNIILRLASIRQSIFTYINSAASNNKNNANFYTKRPKRYKTPWIIVLQMFFWIEIGLEVLKFHRSKATFDENLNVRRLQDPKYLTNVIIGKIIAIGGLGVGVVVKLFRLILNKH